MYVYVCVYIYIYIYTHTYIQGFIQAVLLMLIFEKRLSFRMLYFVEKDHKIILNISWGPGIMGGESALSGKYGTLP